jgi:hypothetical protein
MKRLTAWLTGFAGGAAAYRVFRRRPPAAAPADDPASELKAKLAEARATDRPAEDASAEAGVEARRRSVHDRGRAAIDEMQGPDSG